MVISQNKFGRGTSPALGLETVHKLNDIWYEVQPENENLCQRSKPNPVVNNQAPRQFRHRMQFYRRSALPNIPSRDSTDLRSHWIFRGRTSTPELRLGEQAIST